MQIAQHTFLVAGGGSGLGAATARMIVANGGNVVLADVNEAAGTALARDLGANARFAKTDVTDEASTQGAVDLCVSAFGAIHGAINCAGVAPGERVVGRNGPHALASFERAVKINLIGTFNVIRLAAAKMTVQPAEPSGERGVIVNTSSVASMDGQIGQAAYAASKAGVNGMTLPIARELAKFGVRVMTIAPGIFDTPMLQGMSEEIRASLGAQVPFPPRLGKPEEYASLVKHIVENEVLNGEVIRLDGAIRMTAK
ncbi:SDR family NAD(P)-dependent oxidoreductase [Usitatibacter palustris]|uniref:Putative oxidoreductase n=1 Tax=Usitatibacter palustris TaxID=2732487 RepID=A0A6M4H643_9PROT|nr:SDR family NAD(P)-dependent oxidoreductase [Usitatibacter palustris]QJR14970.1 putative oxidoreductase [Usitatibacter palustris]